MITWHRHIYHSAPIVKTVLPAAPIYKSYAAPVVAAPVYKSYAAPVVHAAPVLHSAPLIAKSYAPALAAPYYGGHYGAGYGYGLGYKSLGYGGLYH